MINTKINIGKIELGETNIALTTMSLLCKYYSVSLEELLGVFNSSNMKISKYSGTLLAATGILHLLIVFVLFGGIFMEMLSDGFFNSIGNNPARAAATWNCIVGFLLITWGATLQCYQNQTRKPAPMFIGYALLVFSIVLCIVMPVSGTWLFIPQAFIILFARR